MFRSIHFCFKVVCHHQGTLVSWGFTTEVVTQNQIPCSVTWHWQHGILARGEGSITYSIKRISKRYALTKHYMNGLIKKGGRTDIHVRSLCAAPPCSWVSQFITMLLSKPIHHHALELANSPQSEIWTSRSSIREQGHHVPLQWHTCACIWILPSCRSTFWSIPELSNLPDWGCNMVIG